MELWINLEELIGKIDLTELIGKYARETKNKMNHGKITEISWAGTATMQYTKTTGLYYGSKYSNFEVLMPVEFSEPQCFENWCPSCGCKVSLYNKMTDALDGKILEWRICAECFNEFSIVVATDEEDIT